MKLINQTSSEYAGWTLGNSSSSVSRFGCAVASASMALDMDFKSIVDDPNHFVNSDLIVWESLATVKDRQWFYQNPADIELIKKYLSQGYRVICETRFNQNEDLMHFVCAIGFEGDKIKIADPIDGTIKWFNDAYGFPARWIYQIVVYEKSFPPENGDALAACLADRLKFWQERDTEIKKNEQLNLTISTLNTEIANKSQDIEFLKAQKKGVEDQVAMLRVENNTLGDKVLSQHDKIEQLNRTIHDLQILSPDTQFQKARAIMSGKGFWFQKYWRLAELLK